MHLKPGRLQWSVRQRTLRHPAARSDRRLRLSVPTHRHYPCLGLKFKADMTAFRHDLHSVIMDRGLRNGLNNLCTMSHKLTRSSAIALAVFSISSAAFANPMPEDTREAGRKTPASAIHTSRFQPQPRSCDPEVSADAATSTGTVAAGGNRDPAETLTLGVSGRERGGDRIENGTGPALVANTSGKSNYCEIFDHAALPQPVSLILLKKCGWLCMRVTF